MQRRAFDVDGAWDDLERPSLEPAALERLGEVTARTLVLVGGLDLDAIHDAARLVVDGLPNVRRADWADVAHLPSMERPADFLELLEAWLAGEHPPGDAALDDLDSV